MQTKIILDLCANHNGDIDLAKKMIIEARKLNVFGVKFQKRDIDSISAEMTNPFLDEKNMYGGTWKEDRAALEFSIEEMAFLKEFAEQQGLFFFCTAFDEKSIYELFEINCNRIKIPSQFYLNEKFHAILTSYKKFKPLNILVSTGMHTWDEIIKGKWFSSADIIFHCISKYPFHYWDANLITLRKMLDYRQLKRKLSQNTNFGYSSHEKEGKAIIYAVLIGAEYIERHYTIDKNVKGADHSISSDFEEMKKIISDIKHAEEILGDEDRLLDEEEQAIAKVFKKC